MKIENIDSELILKFFSKEKINEKIIDLSEEINQLFFSNPIGHNPALKNLIPLDISSVLQIYPPNICILDFFLKNFKDKEDVFLLDYGCGIPRLMYYLKLIDFNKVVGYDDWSQISEAHAKEYLNGVDIDLSNLITLDDIENIPITCISNVGFSILEKDFIRILNIPTLEYIISDYRFVPRPVESEEFPFLTLIKFEEKIVSSHGKEHRPLPDSYLREKGFLPYIVYNGLILIYKKVS